ncbi:transposase [Streptomyces sp. P3]|uniref:transposase n=1 Tax=Streptomyces sp. P3 TaxID=2135430 RepID=UPI00131EF9AE|nr:transposase [Streptomyces sp. P3]
MSAWLADHPGVEVICRDRSTAYAEAGRLGAPDAVHVADRWHIWKNLVEAVEKTAIPHRALLREPEETSLIRTAAPVKTAELAPRPSGEPRHSGRLSDRVREQHAAVHALLDDGLGMRPIARRLSLARNTVGRTPSPRGHRGRTAGGTVDRPQQHPRSLQALSPSAVGPGPYRRPPPLRGTA